MRAALQRLRERQGAIIEGPCGARADEVGLFDGRGLFLHREPHRRGTRDIRECVCRAERDPVDDQERTDHSDQQPEVVEGLHGCRDEEGGLVLQQAGTSLLHGSIATQSKQKVCVDGIFYEDRDLLFA